MWTSQKFTFMISCTLIIGASAAYYVALKKYIDSSQVVTNCTADFWVNSDIPVTLGLFSVELSTSIYGIHAATYVVNPYVS